MTLKFQLGDLVQKTKGSKWKGIVVGTYSTNLTPEGYAVESCTEVGSVQIYPASALERVEQTEVTDNETKNFIVRDVAGQSGVWDVTSNSCLMFCRDSYQARWLVELLNNYEMRLRVFREEAENHGDYSRKQQAVIEHLKTSVQKLEEQVETYKSALNNHATDVQGFDGFVNGYRVRPVNDDDKSIGFIVSGPRMNGVRTNTCVWVDDDDPAHRLLATMLSTNVVACAKKGEV